MAVCYNVWDGGKKRFMNERKISPIYKIIRWLVWLFYPKTEVVNADNLPEEASLIVGNHTQMNGPIACELYFPRERYTWCAGQMMHLRDVPAYAYQDFWSGKPKYIRWFYKIFSYIIAPLSVCVFNNANTVPVYRDSRIINTFRQTITCLREGFDVVIFPEHDVEYNHILYDFEDNFIDVARFYYKKTGRELDFVPLYIAPYLRKMILGKPIRFRADVPIREERARIRTYLMEEITRMAEELPPHTVVPYPNIPRKDYPSSVSGEVRHG